MNPLRRRSIKIRIGYGKNARGGRGSDALPHPSYRTICRSNASYFPPGSRTLSEEPDLKTVGEVREISDEALTSLPDFGRRSSDLRMKLGLPSTDGVRPIKPPDYGDRKAFRL
jgi:hypothetical protein